METKIIPTIDGDIRLEERYDADTSLSFYDVYDVERDRYIGELWSMNEGRALENDLKDFLYEHGY